MSSVSSDQSSSSAAIQGLQYQLNHLSDERDKEVEKSKEDSEKEVSSVRAKNEEQVRRIREENERALKEAKAKANDTVELNRKSTRQEMDDLKKSVYDRSGRINADAENFRDQLYTTKKALSDESEQAARRAREIEDHYQRRMAEQSEGHAEELSTVVAKARDSANQLLSEKEKSGGDSYDSMKTAEQKKYQRLNQELGQERARVLRDSLKTVEDVNNDYQNRARGQALERDMALSKLGKQYQAKLEANADLARKDKQLETEKLRGQVSELSNIRVEEEKRNGDIRAAMVREVGQEYAGREKQIVERYESELGKSKNDTAVTEEYMINRHRIKEREKDDFYTNLLRKNTADQKSTINEITDAYNASKNQLDTRNQRNMAAAEANSERQAKAFDERNREVLTKQGQAFAQSNARMRAELDDQIQALSKELQYNRTSQDITVISPALEEAVRKNIAMDYDKLHQEESRRNQDQIESVRENYSKRLTDTVEDSKTKENLARVEAQRESDQARRMFVDYVYESEYGKNKTVQNLERNHERNSEKLKKNLTKDIDSQRKQYEEIIRTRDIETQDRLSTTNLNNSFSERMLRREFGYKINEMVDKYETKISEIETNYKDLLETQKQDSEKRILELDRQRRLDHEKQEVAFQQRLKQVEQQHDEYRKNMEREFEKQLDDSRRANARLMAKKS